MNILMLGRNMAMMQMGAKPLQDAGHSVMFATQDDDAKRQLGSADFQALLIGMAVEQASRTALKAHLADTAPKIKIFEPMGPADLPPILAQLAS